MHASVSPYIVLKSGEINGLVFVLISSTYQKSATVCKSVFIDVRRPLYISFNEALTPVLSASH